MNLIVDALKKLVAVTWGMGSRVNPSTHQVISRLRQAVGQSEFKLFEVRDEGTFIPGFAFSISREDGYLARRAGYGERCIMFGNLNGGECQYDPYDWAVGRGRTMHYAHHYICKNWDALKSGDVIDVQFILGETKERKKSESWSDQ